MYPRWSIIYVGCCAQNFPLAVLVAASQKNLIFGTPKMENAHLFDADLYQRSRELD
jgi:hypothetical protein